MTALTKPILVLKIGGNQVEDEAFLAGFVTRRSSGLLAMSMLSSIVHGGGKEITELHEPARRGVRDGRGAAGHQPGEHAPGRDGAQRHGEHPPGALAGERGRGCARTERQSTWALMRMTPLTGQRASSLGLVGQVGPVNGEALLQLLDLGVTPVISAGIVGRRRAGLQRQRRSRGRRDCPGGRGRQRLVFVSNVPGVQVAGRTMRALTPGAGRRPHPRRRASPAA